MTLTNRRILLIDDMPSIHDDFRKILSVAPARTELDELETRLFGTRTVDRIGFELRSAFQGQQGVDMAAQACAAGLPYALAFVDMRMPPGLDGAATIAQLWERDPQLQVVLCTAYSDYCWEELLARLDMRDRLMILKKPFDAIEVLQLATMLTAKWSLARQAASELDRLDDAVRARTAELMQANDALQRQISERKQLESCLVQSEKLACVGRLAAGVAHEINNPLAFLGSNLLVLEGYVGDLLQRLDQASFGSGDTDTALALCEMAYMKQDLPELVAESRAGLARVAQIVQGLRDFARVDAAQQWMRADVRQGLDATLAVLRAGISPAIRFEREYGAVPEISCMSSQLNQVFMSLLMNAAEAIGDQPGTITVRTGSGGEQVWIEVSDTGCGIAVQDLAHIFDPFFTTKGIGEGTGLGLSQAYGIVRAHQGRIETESLAGAGTTMRVVLPIEGAAPQAGMARA